MSKYSYGCIPSRGDFRDYQYSAPISIMKALPTKVDLRNECPPVQGQRQLGSCTGFGISGNVWFDLLKQKIQSFRPSELFIYYNERVKENTVQSDAGASIRDGIIVLKTIGVCPDANWPYDISQFAVQPPSSAYAAARLTEATLYQRIYTTYGISQILGCLASGFPVIFGITVYSSFESQQADTTGVIPMPGWSDQVLGGHCLLAVGYSEPDRQIIFRNSWSTSWGDQGYGYLPFDYITNQNLTSDLWSIRIVS